MTIRLSLAATTTIPTVVLALLAALSTPEPAAAQVAERLGRAAARAAEAEGRRQVQRGVRNAIRCALGDRVCEDRARREGRDVIYVDESGRPVNAVGEGDWSLVLDDDDVTGREGYVIRDEVVFALHLVEEDDGSVYLFLQEAEEGEQVARAVVAAVDDDESCIAAAGDSSRVTVRLHRVDEEWVAGSYRGTVRCEDEAVPIEGTFRVPR